MTNSVDPEQLACKQTDLDLHSFKGRTYSGAAVQKLLTFFQQKISEYCILNLLKQLTKWPLMSSLS